MKSKITNKPSKKNAKHPQNQEDKSRLSPLAVTSYRSAKNLSEMMHQALSYLSEREVQILCMRFGLGLESQHTLEEITHKFNISKEEIRQIEAKALKGLLWQQEQGLEKLKGFLT